MALAARLPGPDDSERSAALDIRYVDGSTIASPFRGAFAARPGGVSVATGRPAVRTSRLLAALSTALDLTEGQLPGHALRTCYLAMHVAERMGLDDRSRADLFYAAFLKDAGCSSNAAAVTRIFGGDDIAIKAREKTAERGLLGLAAFSIRSLSSTEPIPLRLRRLISLGLNAPREQHMIEQLRCERGASIARKAGFDEAVGNAILDLHEHWDGHGQPRGLAREQIDPLARILAVCQGLDVFRAARGPEEAIRKLGARRGTWYDPDVAGILLDAASRGLLDELGAPDLVGRTMALEPVSLQRTSNEADVDQLASAFADVIDAKSPFTGAHSQNVASIGEAVAVRLGLPARDVVDVRRAGLLHDLGKLGVPNMILDKPAALTVEEFEQIKRHPELTLRILEPITELGAVAEIAACHHERLDGLGYFRGLTAPELVLGARVVAVADVFEALTADRPYRPAMPTERALEVLDIETGGHLAADAVAALKAIVA